MTRATAGGAPGGACAVPPGFVAMPAAGRAREALAQDGEVAGDLAQLAALRIATGEASLLLAQQGGLERRGALAALLERLGELEAALLHRRERVGLLRDLGARGARAVHDARVLLADPLEEVGLLEQVGEALRLDDDGDDVRLGVAIRRHEVRAQGVGRLVLAGNETRQAVARLRQGGLDAVELGLLGVDVGLHRGEATLGGGEARRRRADLGRLRGDGRAQPLGAAGLRLDGAVEVRARRADEDRRAGGGGQRQGAEQQEAAKGDGRHRRRGLRVRAAPCHPRPDGEPATLAAVIANR